jgi:hypothetical protein
MTLPSDPAFFQLLTDSYARFVGGALVPAELAGEEAARWLYEDAPFAILAHNTDIDPVFVYGNVAAQTRFEYSWHEITHLRSRFSAEAPNRDERQKLLDRVNRDGYANDYRGVRISKSGQRFMIEDATLWQLVDDQGQVHGQAVKIMRTVTL